MAELEDLAREGLGLAKIAPMMLVTSKAEATAQAREVAFAAAEVSQAAAASAAELVAQAGKKALDAVGDVTELSRCEGCMDKIGNFFDKSAMPAVEDAGEGAAAFSKEMLVAASGAATAAKTSLSDVATSAPVTEVLAGGAAIGAFCASLSCSSVSRFCGDLGRDVSRAANFIAKLEIIRDFYQIISLFLIRAERAIVSSIAWLTYVAGTIAIDINFVVPSIPGEVYYVLGVIGAILLGGLCIWVLLKTVQETRHAKVREGHEFETWAKKASKRKREVFIFKYSFIMLVSIYLPATTFALEFLVCQYGSGLLTSCPTANLSDTLAGFIAFICVLVLIIITLLLPYRTLAVISANKPRGSLEDKDRRFNEAGDLVEYSDTMYRRDLVAKSLADNPYLFLFKDYERKFSYYKVSSQMLLKSLLLIPTIFLATKYPIAQYTLSLVFVAGFAAFSVRSTPFLDDELDFVEGVSKITIVITVFLSLLIACIDPDAFQEIDDGRTLDENPSRAVNVLSDLILIVNAISLLCFVLMLGYANGRVKLLVKTLLGRFTFSDSLERREGSASTIIPAWILYIEVRTRLWKEFWRTRLESVNEDDRSVPDRLQELELALREKGYERIRRHHTDVADDKSLIDLRIRLAVELEGVDCCFSGDGGGQASRFGKLWLQGFPFTAVTVPEASEATAFLYQPDDLRRIVDLNASEEIQAKRQFRSEMRSLEGEDVNIHWTETRDYRVPDGHHTEHRRDADGNSRSERVQDYSNIRILLTFEKGTVCVFDEHGENPYTTRRVGFNLSVTFSDGTGSARKPRTGQMHHVRNEFTILRHDRLGLKGDMTVHANTPLAELYERNQRTIDDHAHRWPDEMQDYRKQLLGMRKAKENVLSSGFLFYIYLNENASRESVTEYLRTYETSPVLQELDVEADPAITQLFATIMQVRVDDRLAFWFVFWHDFWKCNGTMSKVKKHAALFSPESETFIGYTYMPAAELRKVIVRCKLARKRTLFSDKIFTLLYEGLARAGRGTEGDVENVLVTEQETT